MKLLKENKLLTAITVIHLFMGPFLYNSLGLIDIEWGNGRIELEYLLDFDGNVLFYWVVTVVLIFMFWLFKK
tara:strand:- start:401 stop:616 length:216 start_codon:yes stop_codon:yes gene_type:complete